MKSYPVLVGAALLSLGLATMGWAQSDSAKMVSPWNDQEPSQAMVLSKLSAEYKKTNPNFNMEFEFVPSSTIEQKISVLMASNDLPEIFAYGNPLALVDWTKKGVTIDFEVEFKKLGIFDSLNPVAVDLVKRTGNTDVLASLPFEMNVEGFWYNKKMFADAGIAIPKTWKELLTASEKLKAKGIQPFSSAGKDAWPLTRLINGMAIRIYGPDAPLKAGRGEMSYTDKGFITAATTLSEMAKKGYFGKNPASIDYNTATDVFLQGKAAMYYMGSWCLRDLNNPKANTLGPDGIGFFNIPIWEGGVDAAVAMKTYCVSAGIGIGFSKKKFDDNMKNWSKAVFPKFGQMAMDDFGIITGFKAQPTDDLPGYTKLVLSELKKAEKSALWFEASMDTKAMNEAWINVQRLVTGEINPQKWAQNMDNAVKKK